MNGKDKSLKFSFEDFIDELKKEIKYHSSGTSYRLRTSELSLRVAMETGKITPFLDRDHASKIVMETFHILIKNELMMWQRCFKSLQGISKKNQPCLIL